MKKYNLGFLTDEEIYNHVKSTVLQYRRSINLKEFNKNIIDPIKLTVLPLFRKFSISF